jgi:hypothetical protein
MISKSEVKFPIESLQNYTADTAFLKLTVGRYSVHRGENMYRGGDVLFGGMLS